MPQRIQWKPPFKVSIKSLKEQTYLGLQPKAKAQVPATRQREHPQQPRRKPEHLALAKGTCLLQWLCMSPPSVWDRQNSPKETSSLFSKGLLLSFYGERSKLGEGWELTGQWRQLRVNQSCACNITPLTEHPNGLGSLNQNMWKQLRMSSPILSLEVFSCFMRSSSKHTCTCSFMERRCNPQELENMGLPEEHPACHVWPAKPLHEACDFFL